MKIKILKFIYNDFFKLDWIVSLSLSLSCKSQAKENLQSSGLFYCIKNKSLLLVIGNGDFYFPKILSP